MGGHPGKLVRGSLYVHRGAVPLLDGDARGLVASAAALAGALDWNVARIGPGRTVGLLDYPGFDAQAFPALKAAARVDVDGGRVRRTSYARSRNPLVLHRKELLVSPDHPMRAAWAGLTARLLALGLLPGDGSIGRRAAWEHALAGAGLDSEGAPLR